MAGVTPRLSPARLADALGSLEVRIDGAHLEHRDILLPDYPGEPRPTSVVHITSPQGEVDITLVFDRQ